MCSSVHLPFSPFKIIFFKQIVEEKLLVQSIQMFLGFWAWMFYHLQAFIESFLDEQVCFGFGPRGWEGGDTVATSQNMCDLSRIMNLRAWTFRRPFALWVICTVFLKQHEYFKQHLKLVCLWHLQFQGLWTMLMCVAFIAVIVLQLARTVLILNKLSHAQFVRTCVSCASVLWRKF